MRKLYGNMNIKEKFIRVGLLIIIIVLGLIVVFPQTLDLVDLIIAENKQQNNSLSNTDKNYKYHKSQKSWSFKQFFAKNIAPSQNEVLDYLLNLPNVKKVECIGDIPKVTYDKKKNKTSPNNLNIKYQVLALNMNTPQSKKGILHLKPKIHTKSYGHLLAWLDANAFLGWNYRHRMRSGGVLHSQTQFSVLMKNFKIKECAF